jgi:isopentenyl diphosphate isomerase/L-lactate dehydrogenase-like FMN-dependent dehydrogenase
MPHLPKTEPAAARAAAAAGTVYCLSHGSVCSIEQVAAMHDGPRWMQVFIYRDRAFTRELADRAHRAGYQALVQCLLTAPAPAHRIDSPVLPWEAPCTCPACTAVA